MTCWGPQQLGSIFLLQKLLVRRRQILTTWIFNFEICLGIDRCELRADDKWQDKVMNTLALIWDPMIYEQFAVSSATWQHSDRFVLFLHLTGSKSIIVGNSLICLSSNEAYYRAKSQPYFGCKAYAWFKRLFSIVSLGLENIPGFATSLYNPHPSEYMEDIKI